MLKNTKTKYTIKISLLLTFSITFFTGCYDRLYDRLVEQGDKLYDEKRYDQAVKYYEKYIELKKNSNSDKVEEVIYKAATIYNLIFNNCENSKHYFELLVRNFPNSKYKDESVFRSIFCPNYIYPQHTKYIFGDSQSYGKNAREIVKISKKNFSEINFISEIYAGRKLITKNKKKYFIKDMNIFEENNNLQEVLIKYPLEKNLKFEYHNMIVEIEKIASVKVKAGIFTNCIAIKKIIKGSNIGNIYYMAPEIGKILISSFYEGKETRIMELISYEWLSSRQYI